MDKLRPPTPDKYTLDLSSRGVTIGSGAHTPSRRTFLQQTVIASGAILLNRASFAENTRTLPSDREVKTVDAHAHIFNARDLHIKGFLANVILRKWPLPRATIGKFANAVLQLDTPTAEDEITILSQSSPGQLESLSLPYAPPLELERKFLEKWIDDPAMIDAVLDEALTPMDSFGRPSTSDEESLFSPYFALKGLYKWSKILRGLRARNTATHLKTYGADLMTPAFVDMDLWINRPGDRLSTPIEMQIKVAAKVNLHLKGKMLPLVPFDPLRQALDLRSEEGRTALELVNWAVTEMGFIGVKLYPPMGFQAYDNPPNADMPLGKKGKDINDALTMLYDWAEKNNVPLMAHCNESQGPSDDAEAMAHPKHWAKALEMHSNLRVNLGHSGGFGDVIAAAKLNGKNDWWTTIVDTAQAAPDRVYADTGYHDDIGSSATDEDLNTYFAQLKRLESSVMYGSDWQMIAILRGHEKYLDRFRKELGDHGNLDSSAFFAGNALRFFGLDSIGAPNSETNLDRLQAFYSRNAIPTSECWVLGQHEFLKG